jgi:hypothetical protein
VGYRFESCAAHGGEVSELVDEHDLGSCAFGRRSSSLLFPTRYVVLGGFMAELAQVEDLGSHLDS